MVDPPLVSIIMPVRNGMPYLTDTLESILNQTYEHWELIVINDHSEDGTEITLTTYAHQDDRISYHNATGRGIIDALRQGYAGSVGSYITRMDADDLMPMQKIERLLHAAKRDLNTVSTGYVKYFKDQGIADGYRRYEEWLNSLCDSNSHFSDIYKECVIPSPCWMMHRSAFERIGSFDSTTYPEDYDLAFRMYKHGLSVNPVLETLHLWRDHDERASRNDVHYKDNRFLDLKLHYFVSLECSPDQEVLLIGAGKKGKYIAKGLLSHNIPFRWFTNNLKKVNHNIYGTILSSVDNLSSCEYTKCIVAVANRKEQNDITAHYGDMLDLVFFV